MIALDDHGRPQIKLTPQCRCTFHAAKPAVCKNSSVGTLKFLREAKRGCRMVRILGELIDKFVVLVAARLDFQHNPRGPATNGFSPLFFQAFLGAAPIAGATSPSVAYSRFVISRVSRFSRELLFTQQLPYNGFFFFGEIPDFKRSMLHEYSSCSQADNCARFLTPQGTNPANSFLEIRFG